MLHAHGGPFLFFKKKVEKERMVSDVLFLVGGVLLNL
jgi:hypothetical protein